MRAGAFGLIITFGEFNERMNEKMDESARKGGTANGIDMEIEYWANLADSLVWVATKELSGDVLKQTKIDIADVFGISDDLADEMGDGVGVYLKDYWYNDKSKFEDFKETKKTQDYFNGISDAVNSFWELAQNWIAARRDPLVLDLDGDGIETLGVNATTHVVFDHDGDGLKTGTGWVSGDDGLLVLDRNGNGTIDNGGELFGDQTLVNGAKASDGFAALSAEDSNSDGTFDANDSSFKAVQIWQDTNSDGISQTSELHTLTELGIASINLTSTASGSNLNGNTQTATSAYTKSDGTTSAVGNLNFTQNLFYRKFTDKLTLTEEALALPDTQGSGAVRDLREASTLSAGLTSTLQTMRKTYETHDEMMAQIDTLLAQWAGTSSMATSVNNQNFKNEKVVA